MQLKGSSSEMNRPENELGPGPSAPYGTAVVRTLVALSLRR